ncbi:MAG: tRNA (N(6)-L-threonylcarbamoyladenosine(37)-C(2))-methylthiotransferase [Candidatus Alkanophagales archaeon]
MFGGAGRGTRVYIETFGCTANLGDERRLRAVLRRSGYELVSDEAQADVVIVNTCTVVRRTELNVLRRIGELREKGKEVVVAGCMAAAQPELLRAKFGDVKLITPAEVQRLPLDFELDGVIGIVNIANGCVGDCAYCIVKRARGRLRSYEPHEVVRAVESLVRRGAKEIRLTAQDCSAYGLDFARGARDARGGSGGGSRNSRLPSLLSEVAGIDGDFKIRVGMMNPFTLLDILDETLDAFEHEKVFKFFHVPVQSGSDSVLKDMNRRYSVDDFRGIVRSIRRRFKDCVLCTDFIVGFPTETEEDFRQSLELLKELKPEKVNITRFSPRPGTEAAKLKDLLEREKKRRSRIFAETYHKIALEKNRELVGAVKEVLVTEEGVKGGVIARDAAYRTVVLRERLPLGTKLAARIVEARSTYLVATPAA